MCYVLENFYSNSEYLRWKVSVQSWFFLKNSSLIVKNFQKPWKNESRVKLNKSWGLNFYHFQKFFIKKIIFFTKSLTVFKNNFLISQKTQVLTYWALHKILENFKNIKILNSFIDFKILKTTFLETKVIKIFSKAMLFKNVTCCYINSLLSLWLNLSLFMQLKTFYLYPISVLKVLPFFNSYFFKVYDI